MNSTPELKLDWCTHSAALFACQKWHYSGSMQAGKCAKVGVWEGGKFIGAVVFSAGSGGTTLWAKQVGLKRQEMAELCRIALSKHTTPVSRIVPIAIRFLRKQSTGLRLLVSYADPRRGHNGGIYQAMGWIYIGETSPDRLYVDKFGTEHHPRMVAHQGIKISFGIQKIVPRIGECEAVITPGKHKYLMALDDEVRRRIEPLRQLYPKRVRSENGDTSADHAEKGGSTPTRALQNSEAAV